MVFSSPIFLFGFLPLVLLASFACGRRGQNGLLLCASLLFYAWGEPIFVLALLGSIGCNWAIGRSVESAQPNAFRILGLGVGLNLLLLTKLKYGQFLLESGANLLGIENGWLVDSIDAWPTMPIGISFYTFQAISYLVDVYRGHCHAQRSLAGVGLYLSMFPQLIAGPIVRYSEIEAQLTNRKRDASDFNEGVARFVRGLSKKVLIADTLGIAADMAFEAGPGSLSVSMAWLGLICYGLQLYFDFSGYSDMAIGIGRMFGFRFPENFDFPYESKSVRDFWRRWHMTLSRWFRDYLYIPLGGNRKSPFRVALNLALVFVLCGFWHGASWSFVVWGLYHGAFLAIERLGFGALLERLPSFLQRGYLLLAVFVGWILFRAESLEFAVVYAGALVGVASSDASTSFIIGLEVYLALVFAILFSSRAPLEVWSRWVASSNSMIGVFVGRAAALALLAVCMAAVASSSYSPFLYFRF